MVLVHDIPQCSNPLMQMTRNQITKHMDKFDNPEFLEQMLEEAMEAAEQQVASARDKIRFIADMMKDALDKNDEDGIMMLGVMLLPINNVYAQFMSEYKRLQNTNNDSHDNDGE